MKSILQSYVKLRTKPLSEDTVAKQDYDQEEVQQENTIPPVKELHTSFGDKKPTLGDYLQEARVNSSLTIHQVSQSTKIHTVYLEAIEREDFANTPPTIYVKAYIKRLCDLYKINPDYALSLYESQLGEPDKRVPEDLVRTLEETKQENSEAHLKVKKYVKLASIGASALLGLIIIITILFSVKGNSIEDRPLTSEEKQILRNNIEQIISINVIEPESLFSEIRI